MALPKWQEDLLDEIIDAGVSHNDTCTDWVLERTPRNLRLVEAANRWIAKEEEEDYEKPCCRGKEIISDGVLLRDFLRSKGRRR